MSNTCWPLDSEALQVRGVDENQKDVSCMFLVHPREGEK